MVLWHSETTLTPWTRKCCAALTDYINFCLENTVHTKKVQCFPNYKTWETPNLKALLNEKKKVFRGVNLFNREVNIHFDPALIKSHKC